MAKRAVFSDAGLERAGIDMDPALSLHGQHFPAWSHGRPSQGERIRAVRAGLELEQEPFHASALRRPPAGRFRLEGNGTPAVIDDGPAGYGGQLSLGEDQSHRDREIADSLPALGRFQDLQGNHGFAGCRSGRRQKQHQTGGGSA
jgi:hypothetical protein